MSYNWTPASTQQGRERLKELVSSLNGPEFIIAALSYKQGERFLQSIFKERAFSDKSDIDRFLDDPIPIKEFLDPSPIQPKEDKDARIKELELVIEHAADCLDRIHEDDDDAWEKIGRIYHNLENKTRYEV